jgi:hypothetical protein
MTIQIDGPEQRAGSDSGLDLNHRKELFSQACVRAVAFPCGYTFTEPEIDVGIDFTVAGRGPPGTRRSPRVDAQIKCTSDDIRREDTLAFPLPVKNYDELRLESVSVPRLLVVVLVPADLSEWCDHSKVHVALRRCGYWCSLKGVASRQVVYEHDRRVILTS